jgi:hypothetical protein
LDIRSAAGDSYTASQDRGSGHESHVDLHEAGRANWMPWKYAANSIGVLQKANIIVSVKGVLERTQHKVC